MNQTIFTEANMLAMRLLEEAGPNTELSWLLYVFLGFFFLMVLVGWWSSRQNGEQTGTSEEASSHSPKHHE
jgi:hypothetical protein